MDCHLRNLDPQISIQNPRTFMIGLFETNLDGEQDISEPYDEKKYCNFKVKTYYGQTFMQRDLERLKRNYE